MALHNTSYLATWYLNEGVNQPRLPRSAHPSLTPCQLYKTENGWIFLMCNKEKFWPALCEAIGRPAWGDDPRFLKFKDRLANRDLITELLDEALQAGTTAGWLEHFAGKVPAAPVNDIASALDNPFVVNNGRLQTIEHPADGPYRVVAPPVRTGEPAPNRPSPGPGADTEEVLKGVGYSGDRIAALRNDGVI